MQQRRRLDRAKKPNWREGAEEKGREAKKKLFLSSLSLSLSLSLCFSACFPDSEWREIPPRVWQAAATSASLLPLPPDALRGWQEQLHFESGRPAHGVSELQSA